MKTISRISAAVLTASLVLASCAKEDLLESKATEAVAAGTRVIAVSFSNSSTKSELGANGVTPKFVKDDKIKVSNGSGTEVCTVSVAGDVASISTKLTGALTAVYPAAVWSDSEPYFAVPATQDGTFASANISTATIAADAESALFEHQTAVLRFYVDASIGVKSLKVTSSTADIAAGAKTITVDPEGDVTLDTVTDDPDKRICYVAVLPTTSATDLTFTSVTTTQTAYAASTVKRTASSVTLVKNRIYDAFVPYYIDLGANGKWAYCNIGAFLPEEYGEYFAWGETVGHKLNSTRTAFVDGHSFDWTTAPFNGGASSYNATYFAGVKDTECPDGVLALKNDAANVNWGDSWRMPSKAEFEGLKSVEFWKTGTSDIGHYFGTASAYIFLPACGSVSGTTMPVFGHYSDYYSSTLDSGSQDNAYELNPWVVGDGDINIISTYRYRGMPIRPVYDPPYVPPVPEPLPGLFSVSEDKKVYFSPGNLRYTVGTKKWSFFDEQYEFGPASYSEGHASEISFFTWGYNPTQSIIPDGNHSNNVSRTSGDLTHAEDWGSQIDDGNFWRTLTVAEWQYLFSYQTYYNTKRAGKYKVGVTVCDVAWCIILVPDECLNGYIFDSSKSVYTQEDWKVAEMGGLVCLPPAGCRIATSCNDVGNYGMYWTASAKDNSLAKAYTFGLTYPPVPSDIYRSSGYSVRLVKEPEK